ncbi:MAG TPA: DNA methyltransferase, partial [Candidatus Nanopelagicales bacterium]|nr:DNA methyltransferase [Candidatus Nanopelagicales bacterium]
MDVASFIAKWSRSSASERANKDIFLVELCDLLGVPRPDPATGDVARDRYVFEKAVPTVQEGGKITVKRIDLYKHGCFLLEAKQGASAGSKKAGTARRGTATWDLAMDDARGQALGYARSLDDPPPFLIVCDIGHMFELYADFDGTRRWPPFPNAQKNRIHLTDLAQHIDTLRALWTEPLSLDPARRAVRVTREVAASLGELARRLESEGNPPESVAEFLMRCLFTMFAEDVGLLPERLFTDAIEQHWLPDPPAFPGGIQALWEAMNGGQHFGFVGKLLRFNGGLFAQPSALRLSREALEELLRAAKHDWSSVEPSIFGTLLERALDPKERHKLGAHYTPRAYVERLVRPTIEEPLRTEWENVQTEARKLYVDGKEEDARKVVKAFHRRLSETRVLDPACGSGNFLYVTLDLFKRLESEVLALLHDLGERQELLYAATIRVTPAQFFGIEKKRWAKEIAELVLWIGYLQWHFRTHGRLVPPPEPVLQDYRNIECRDAVLAYDREEMVRDAKGKPVSRWDGETMKKHPVTGEPIPDESAQVPLYRYVKPRKAEWPKADFIVGNPPFIGNKRMRILLGNGYVDALRSAHEELPETCDFVMYWWYKAAGLLQDVHLRRFG